MSDVGARIGSAQPADGNAILRELDATRSEIVALRSTKTFRWTGAARRLSGATPPRHAHARQERSPSSSIAGRSGGPYAPPRIVGDLDDCWFYHSMDLPTRGERVGEWDLRPAIDAYLGNHDYAGKRVLEVGPASGFVTAALEQRQASVVSIELANADDFDLVPAAWVDVDDWVTRHGEGLERLKNAYWLAHADLGLQARVHYGDARRLPPALGTFDVSFIGAVLLHARDPLGIVTSCAARTTETLVVADVFDLDPDGPTRRGTPVTQLYPSWENRAFNRWWMFSPEFFERLFSTLGFVHTRVVRHDQDFVAIGETRPWFTVVGSR